MLQLVITKKYTSNKWKIENLNNETVSAKKHKEPMGKLDMENRIIKIKA